MRPIRLTFLFLLFTSLFSQVSNARPEIVNITTKSFSTYFNVTIHSFDTSVVAIQNFGSKFNIPIDSILYIEVPNDRNTFWGIGIGLLSGAVIGGIVSDNSDKETNSGYFKIQASELATPIISLLGGIVGGFIGYNSTKEYDFEFMTKSRKLEVLKYLKQ